MNTIINIGLLLLFVASTVVFTTLSIDVVTGYSYSWGILHYLHWLFTGMAMSGTGFAIYSLLKHS
jgi:hypothetical protein